MSDITTRVSVVGEAIYPHLNKPDVRFNEHGEFKVTLKVKQQDASAMVKLFDQACEDSLASAEKEAKGKKINYEGATGVTFTSVGEAEGSFLEQEIKGGKFKTKKQR